jgi:hypothetical protein
MSSEANQQQPNTNTPVARDTLNPISGRKLALISLLTIFAAVLTSLFWGDTANLFGIRRFFSSSARTAAGPISAAASGSGSASVATVATAKDSTSDTMSSSKTPIYFLSHGGVSTTLHVQPSNPRNIFVLTSHPAKRNVRCRTPSLPQTSPNRT